MLKQKSKAFQALNSRHKCNFNSVTSCKIKSVQFDWGGEYQAFMHYLLSNGIIIGPHALIHMNRMVLLNKNIGTLLNMVSLY